MTLTNEEPQRAPQSERFAARQERRRQLINAAIDSIAKRGFSDTTLDTVARGAGLSHGTINFHFKSKELLFIETLTFLAEEHYEHWRTAVSKAGASPQEQMIALIETDFAPAICNPRKLAVWFAFWGEAQSRPAYLEICGKKDRHRFTELTRLCQQLKRDGGYVSLDPKMIAKSMEAFIDGLWLNLLLYPDVFLRDEARRDCLAFLAGIFPRHFPLPGTANSRDTAHSEMS